MTAWRHTGSEGPEGRTENSPTIAPDSLERIAQEIEEADVDGCTDWAERIRRLAKDEG